ncbi:Predicted nucleotidyltransferase [Desulfonispora thiosulfatigenes DSM 11270]|uniref:Predicted nucleotidyltransferase n=1 Tax=Desulfonispora thiosulfatigenes DSM 11270 TaxID=656914 RepID=A0A1W1UPC9_DESTI|nr:nucleotidyltransferase domain-containing protein [Desulfonispora thiosulfatigenes]SMB82564.1 Predicted nucleotidyltransferase [Desulfonispora thiosulfatigenes DSM 11270]
MKEDILQKLKYFIKEIDQEYKIKLAYLFGSFARGEENDQSDSDIAICFMEEYSSFDDVMIRGDLIERGKETLKRKVDILNLDKAPISLKYIVVQQGIILKDNNERATFESLVLREYFDFAYYAEKYNAAILESIKNDEYFGGNNG